MNCEAITDTLQNRSWVKSVDSKVYISSFNFSIGIRYTFGKKEKKE